MSVTQSEGARALVDDLVALRTPSGRGPGLLMVCRPGGRWAAGALVGASPSPATTNSRKVCAPRAQAASATADERLRRRISMQGPTAALYGSQRRCLVNGDSSGIGGAAGPREWPPIPPGAAPLPGSARTASRTAACPGEGWLAAAAPSGRKT